MRSSQWFPSSSFSDPAAMVMLQMSTPGYNTDLWLVYLLASLSRFVWVLSSNMPLAFRTSTSRHPLAYCNFLCLRLNSLREWLHRQKNSEKPVTCVCLQLWANTSSLREAFQFIQSLSVRGLSICINEWLNHPIGSGPGQRWQKYTIL